MVSGSVPPVIASVLGKPYLIGMVHMEACNHCTFSRAIIGSVTDIGMNSVKLLLWYLTVLPIAISAVVSDSAAYCKKAHREVLSAVLPNSVHVLCLAHIVDLASRGIAPLL